MALKSPIRITPRVFKSEHRYAAAAARMAFRPDRAVCPRCKTGSLEPTDDKEWRRCDECGSAVSLDDLAIHHGNRLDDTAAQREDYFRRHARQLMQIAVLWLLFTTPMSVYAGSTGMFIAGVVIAYLIFVGWFNMRYRAWQAATGRIYEAKAPFGDFIRDELRSLTGGRG